MPFTPRLEEAFAFAAEKHRAQVRKGTGVPYLTHLMAVAATVGDHGGDESQVIAALLHDIVEDQGVSFEEIAARFGPAVAEIVAACTDATSRPKPSWRERKERHVTHLRGAPAAVKLVVVSDKLHNAQSIVRDHRTLGPEVWRRFSAPRADSIWYYRAMADALAEGWEHPLIDELRGVVAVLETLPA
jgi:(p)ppGpp synthase/HD superfamily hydrolase